MNNQIRISAAGSALAIAAALAFSGQAMADTVTAKFTSMSSTLNTWYSVQLPPGGLNPTIKTGGTTTGIFNFVDGNNTDTGGNPSGPIDFFGTNQFVSFCIDLQDVIYSNQEVTWDIVSLAAAPDPSAGPMGADKAEAVAKVLGYQIASGVLNDARLLSDVQKQATQLVLWEIVHEAGNTYDLYDGTATFWANSGRTAQFSGALATEIDLILANFQKADAMGGLVGLTNNDGTTKYQDYIAQVVPIPAAAWLFGSALIGMAGIGYRRGRAA
jgi:hypothetical protein